MSDHDQQRDYAEEAYNRDLMHDPDEAYDDPVGTLELDAAHQRALEIDCDRREELRRLNDDVH